MREFHLLQHVYAHNAELQARQGGAVVLIPPGDDMALLELRQRRVLVATDQVIEGRHFTSRTPLRAVGRKAVLRNLSDIAAMAAVPAACVATVALPTALTEAQALELFEGLRTTALAFGCPLAGGDTGIHAANSAHAPLVVTVTVLAEPGPSGRVVERRGAKAGDHLCVTGSLGGSMTSDGGGRHLDFPPRVPHALMLVHAMGDALHAMIDVSDGLGRDTAHLAAAAGLDAEIDAALLPCTPGITWRHAMSDGEDYELAFACSTPPPRELLGVPVTVVGRFVPGTAGSPTARVWVRADGARVDAANFGWEHGG